MGYELINSHFITHAQINIVQSFLVAENGSKAFIGSIGLFFQQFCRRAKTIGTIGSRNVFLVAFIVAESI